jgi:ribosomal protein S1
MSDAPQKPTWEEVKAQLGSGTAVVGTVRCVAPFGVFVDLGVGFDGLLRVPEMVDRRFETMDDYPQIGESVAARVLHHDDKNRQIVLIQKDLALTDQH